MCLLQHGKRDKANIVYFTSLPVIFSVKKYADVLWEVSEALRAACWSVFCYLINLLLPLLQLFVYFVYRVYPSIYLLSTLCLLCLPLHLFVSFTGAAAEHCSSVPPYLLYLPFHLSAFPTLCFFACRFHFLFLAQVAKERNITVHLRHHLIEVKPDTREAVFQNLDSPEDLKTLPVSVGTCLSLLLGSLNNVNATKVLAGI